MKKVAIVLSALLLLFIIGLKIAMPIVVTSAAEKICQKKGLEFNCQKVSFKLLTFDFVFKGLDIKKKGKSFLTADKVVVKKIDLLHGTEPRSLSIVFKGLVHETLDGYMKELCSVIENRTCERSIPLDGGGAVSLVDSNLLIEKVAINNSTIGEIGFDGVVGAFSYSTWEKAVIDSFSLSYSGEKQVLSLLESEMKSQKVSTRKELYDKLSTSAGFTVAANNLARDLFGLSGFKKDEEKRLDFQKKLLQFVKDGRGVALNMKKRKGVAGVSLREVPKYTLRKYVRKMEYDFTVL